MNQPTLLAVLAAIASTVTSQPREGSRKRERTKGFKPIALVIANAKRFKRWRSLVKKSARFQFAYAFHKGRAASRALSGAIQTATLKTAIGLKLDEALPTPTFYSRSADPRVSQKVGTDWNTLQEPEFRSSFSTFTTKHVAKRDRGSHEAGSACFRNVGLTLEGLCNLSKRPQHN